MRVIATPLATLPVVAPFLRAVGRPLRPVISVIGQIARRSPTFFTLFATMLLFVPVIFLPRESVAALGAGLVLAAACAGATRAAARSATADAGIGLAANLLLAATFVVAWWLLGQAWAVVLSVVASAVGLSIAGPPQARPSRSEPRTGLTAATETRGTTDYVALGCVGAAVLAFIVFVVVSWITQFSPQ